MPHDVCKHKLWQPFLKRCSVLCLFVHIEIPPVGASAKADRKEAQGECETGLPFATNKDGQPLEAIKLHAPSKANRSIQPELSHSFQPDTPEGDQELLHTLSTMSTVSGQSTGPKSDPKLDVRTSSDAQNGQQQGILLDTDRQLSGKQLIITHAPIATQQRTKSHAPCGHCNIKRV